MNIARKISVVVAAGLVSSLGATQGGGTATALARSGPLANPAGTEIADWNAAAGRAAVAACIAPYDNPLHESRMYAMAHLAIHDALNAIATRYRAYSVSFHARNGASVEAAVAAAAHDALAAGIADISAPFPQACRDAGTTSVQAYYDERLAAIPDGPAKADGIAAGQRAAAAVVALRREDGADTRLVVPDYPQGTEPGAWRFTPGLPFAFAPGWGRVLPFALKDADQIPAAPPLPLSSDRYARDLNEVRTLGGDGVSSPTTRSEDQTQVALFWWESSPLAWNRIARGLAEGGQLDLWQQARLFGLLNAAMADGYIASFSKKYQDTFWRPVTAIREAGGDGNPATEPDADWTPLRTTPPIPDHDSAHAVEGGAASMVLRQFFGTDRREFSNCSNSLPERTCAAADPILRHFHSFSEAAQENASSRVYIGFHFRYATEVGLKHGQKIGQWVAGNILEPVP